MAEKEQRLQVRMPGGLLNWFRKSAVSAGGMSRVVYSYVEGLYARETGQPWSGEGGADGERPNGERDGRTNDPA